MRKNKKDDKLLLTFKLIYKDIFLNTNFLSGLTKHFDKKCGFAVFALGLLDNQIGWKKLQKHVEINTSDWLRLFSDIYDDNSIQNVYEELCLNPIIPLEKIEKTFDCFNNSINKIINYFEMEQFNLNMNKNQIAFILKTAFGYIMYNCIECKINYRLKDILADPEYDQKLTMISNNTKLFAKAKLAITNVCGGKISDLISLLLGISNDLSLER